MYSYSSKDSLSAFYKHLMNIAKASKEDLSWEMLKENYRPWIVTKTEYNKETNKTEVIEYFNIPAAFDIETSSFYQVTTPDPSKPNKIVVQKMACMSCNQFGIDGKVVVRRQWSEFRDMLNEVVRILGLNHNRRLIIGVHNLSYEFHWIKDMFEWESVFAREKHAPIKALTTTGLEFRCTYTLSGLGLEKTAENLTKYKVRKKVGDWDYDLIRTPITPITKKEKGYAVFDIIAVMNYIEEQIEQYGSIVEVPLTNTGRVRKYCREKCLKGPYANNYRSIMRNLTLDGAAEYEFLMDALTAGFTHANYLRAGDIEENVYSFDFTSSYPACFFDKMPMSKGQWIKITDIKQIENMSDDYYVVFEVEFNNIKRKEGIGDSPISKSKCTGCIDVKEDNGRVLEAGRIQTKLTSDDWWYVSKAYDIKGEIKIGRAIRYHMDFLPAPLLQCVIDFYKGKTELKDVVGNDENETALIAANYQNLKGMLNSIFGCTLTRVDGDEIIFKNGVWDNKAKDLDQVVEDMNKDKNRFLFTPWGLRICSNARKRLWSGILELGNDDLYQDTDSVKFVHYENHKEYFEEYNKAVTEKIRNVCEARGLDPAGTCPKTVKGKEKPLGVWDSESVKCPEYEDRYGNKITEIYARRFKTLGAKRYLCEVWDESKQQWKIKATIAGLNKKKGSDFIAHNPEGIDPFEFFDDYMEVDEEHSGRLTHTYSPDGEGPFHFKVTDYLGNEYEGEELSFINLTKSKYSMTLSDSYSFLLVDREESIL